METVIAILVYLTVPLSDSNGTKVIGGNNSDVPVTVTIAPSETITHNIIVFDDWTGRK